MPEAEALRMKCGMCRGGDDEGVAVVGFPGCDSSGVEIATGACNALVVKIG